SDPRALLILGRPFLRTAGALIDVHGEEMILRDESRVYVPNVLSTHPTLILDSNFIPSDNSLPKFETYFDIEEKNSGCTTIHADISLPGHECFNFDFKARSGARPMRNKERASWDLGTGSHGVLGEVIGTVQVNASVPERAAGEKGVLAGNAVAG
nr:hypothetical protein [Tanacetum cinerariifolium]